MSKIVKLSESDLSKIIQNVLLERLGVPDGIVDGAEIIVNKISNNLKKLNIDEFTNNEYEFTLHTNIKISDYYLTKITLLLDFEFNDDIDSDILYYQAQVGIPTKTSGYNYEIVGDLSDVQINMFFAIKTDIKKNEFIKYFIGLKSDLVGVISHELHHIYDDFKRKTTSGKVKSEYTSFQNLRLGNVPPINQFIFTQYYTHAIENIVRPSEMFGDMKMKGITKSQFKEYFLDSKIIKELKIARDFSFDDMVKSLHKHIDTIDDIFKYEPNIDYDLNGSDEEKINRFLEIVFFAIKNEKLSTYKSFLMRTINPLRVLFGAFSGDESLENIEDEYQKYIKEVKKQKNYVDFFVNEQKRINFVADKLIRKLSKLYDMAKDDIKEVKEQSIFDWETYHKVRKTAQKTLGELKKHLQSNGFDTTDKGK